MKLERGIVRNTGGKVYVYAVGKIYHNIRSGLSLNQKILGMNKCGQFETCYEFKLKNGEAVYGFILVEDLYAMAYLILPVLNYVSNGFDILKEYQTGESICLIFNDIVGCEPLKF